MAIKYRSDYDTTIDDEFDIIPNPGPQSLLLESKADITIFGGAAGGGKSYGLLLDVLKYAKEKRFKNWRGVIFRRLSSEMTGAGGIWEDAKRIFLNAYPSCRPVASPTHRIYFPSGAQLEFRHLNRDDTVESYRSSSYSWIGFEEVNQFTSHQFFYMTSRNRNAFGYPNRVRCTTNPDSDSWLKEFVSWWINPDTGYAIRERANVVRYYLRDHETDKLLWYSTKSEAMAANPTRAGKSNPKSVVFIPSRLKDNPTLYNSDYRSQMMELPRIERERLLGDEDLGGNWKISAEDGLFKREWFPVLRERPKELTRIVRAWDLAATAERDGNQPCYTAGVLMGVDKSGVFYVLDVVRFRAEPSGVMNVMAGVANTDRTTYGNVETFFEQEGGSGGEFAAQQIIKNLAGFTIRGIRPQGNKQARSGPVQSQAEAGNIKLIAGEWVTDYLNELVKFPFGTYADQVDATSLALSQLAAGRVITTVTTADILKSYMTR